MIEIGETWREKKNEKRVKMSTALEKQQNNNRINSFIISIIINLNHGKWKDKFAISLNGYRYEIIILLL